MPNESTPEGAALPTLSDKHAWFVEQYFACNLNAAAAAHDSSMIFTFDHLRSHTFGG